MKQKYGYLFLVLQCFLHGGVGGCTYFKPKYRVYSQEMEGIAKLKEAESSRKIAILEAEAKKESAKSLSEAEVIRAKGIAEANKIISDSITEEYLRYKFKDKYADWFHIEDFKAISCNREIKMYGDVASSFFNDLAKEDEVVKMGLVFNAVILGEDGDVTRVEMKDGVARYIHLIASSDNDMGEPYYPGID